MTIAFDFDETFAAAVPLFRAFAELAKADGHTIVMVTGRSDDDEGEIASVVGDLMPVVFAGMEWKRDAAVKAGFNVDVWIDDSPEWVGLQSGPAFVPK